MRRVTLRVLILLASLSAASAAAQERQPIYVGARVCGTCHSGETFNHQFSKWLLSKHAGAFASLAAPESREIAEWSGIPQEPQESRMCLGCHATGAEAEDWEKDADFHMEEGVQCEKCHGPGSEHVDAHRLADVEAMKQYRLTVPSADFCLGCHQTKGTHEAVLKRPAIDLAAAWKTVAHPSPTNPKPADFPPLPAPAAAAPRPKYTGTLACAACHQGPESGYQYSKWRKSAHARAYASLATPAALEIAGQMGVNGDPQRAEACLKCHTTSHYRPEGGFLDTFHLSEGVGCEACHGPGSAYSPEAIMKDPAAARAAGLWETNRETCAACHKQAHGKLFDYATALAAIAHPTEPPKLAAGPQYKSPLNMAISPDGRELYVTCNAADSVCVIDVARRAKTAEIPVGGHPVDVIFSPQGGRAYVTNWLDDSVSVIDTAARRAVKTFPVGDEPRGLSTDRTGKRLYVLNASSDDISVIDTESFAEVKRLAASRGPWALALSPDGTQLCATNSLSRFVKPRTPSISEVTIIDTDRAVVDNRATLPGANLLLGAAWSPTGEFALVTLARTKNLVPMTRLLQGWTITNGLGIVWRDGRTDQILLDEPTLGFSDPTQVAITPDGRLALVTSATSDRVAVVDIGKMLAIVRAASDEDREHTLPNHRGTAPQIIIKHIAVKNSPRDILITPDGRTAFVANALDDSLTVIDLKKLEAAGRIDLGGSRVITRVREGERLFHSSKITFQRQYACHTCHPGGHIDDVTYDIESDGIGLNPVDNRTLRGILDTAPFKWTGTNPSLSRQCGMRLSVFFTRIQPFTPEELAAVDNYVCTIPRPPNRYRPLGAELTEAQRRGKAIFHRTRTNDGRTIPAEQRCATCHFAPLYTDRRLHDVGTRGPIDDHAIFDTPHLNNIYDSAPYLHDGRAQSLEEIWTVFNPYDTHGITNDMTKDQLNDLIEFLKTL